MPTSLADTKSNVFGHWGTCPTPFSLSFNRISKGADNAGIDERKRARQVLPHCQQEAMAKGPDIRL